MADFMVSGLTSGIDYGSLIDQLIQIERQRKLQPLQEKKTQEQSKLNAYSTLTSKLSTMKSAADTLRKASTFAVKKAEVSDSTVLSASASSTAIPGNYTISEITQLAQAHKITNVDAKSLPDKDTTIVLSAGQTFQFTVNGTTTTITASSDLTLEGLVSEINNANGGVTATIINDGNATNPYRLVLTSNTTGASGAITIDLDESVLDLDNSSGTGGITTLQAAQDAVFKVDGLSITKSSNTVSDVIEGVTFTLKKVDATGSYTITVSNDIDTIKSNIRSLIDAYNDVVNYISGQSSYDQETHTGGPLFNESTTESILRRLRSIITSAISGLSEDTKVLAQVGVKTNRDGTLTLDESVLSNKLSTDFSDVENLFIYNSNTGIEGVADKLYDELDEFLKYGTGVVEIRKKGIQKIIDKYDADIRDVERQIEDYEQQLKIKFGTLEALLTTLNTQSRMISAKLQGQ